MIYLQFIDFSFVLFSVSENEFNLQN